MIMKTHYPSNTGNSEDLKGLSLIGELEPRQHVSNFAFALPLRQRVTLPNETSSKIAKKSLCQKYFTNYLWYMTLSKNQSLKLSNLA